MAIGAEDANLNQKFDKIWEVVKIRSNKVYPYNLLEDVTMNNGFESELSDDKLIQEVEKIIHTLKDIEQKIIHLWYVEALTLSAIGKMFGKSSSRIGQLRNTAVRKLRHPSRFNHLIFAMDMGECDEKYYDIGRHLMENREICKKCANFITQVKRTWDNYKLDIDCKPKWIDYKDSVMVACSNHKKL